MGRGRGSVLVHGRAVHAGLPGERGDGDLRNSLFLGEREDGCGESLTGAPLARIERFGGCGAHVVPHTSFGTLLRHLLSIRHLLIR